MAACFHGDEVKFKSLFSEQAIHSRSNVCGILFLLFVSFIIDFSRLLFLFGQDGKTTLMFACMGGHSHLAQILLECGVNENSRTNVCMLYYFFYFFSFNSYVFLRIGWFHCPYVCFHCRRSKIG